VFDGYYPVFVWYVYMCGYNNARKYAIQNCVYTHLSEDEPVWFETCIRRQKLKTLNQNINLKRVHFVGLCCITYWFECKFEISVINTF
jgi:hypothetical protein